ncbi:MAG: YitT family protein [Erysipelotrichaceae bacterium]|nr:YitT family protein [Erysipelotrichaceae bacterium]
MNSETKIDIRRLFYTVLGIAILGAGVALAVRAGLGTSPLDVLIELVHFKIGISVGRLTFFCQVMMVVIALILWPKTIGIGTVMAMFLTQFPIDLVYDLVGTYDSFYINLFLCVIGTALTAFGAAVIIRAGLGMGTYEALTFSISNRFKIKYLYVKYGLEAIFLLLLILFHGTIGIGTLISYLFLGKLITVFIPVTEKWISFPD